MAIINNNVGNVKFLRNGNLFATHEAALTAINNEFGSGATIASDGTAILARYGNGNDVKTLVGFIYFASNESKSLTILDVEGASADVDKLRQEINAKLGSGITSANTATAQLTALSGGTFTPGTSSSADTSVEGAKAYAYDLLGTLEYTDTAETGSYVSKVDQVDGVISTTKVELPSYTDSAVAKKFVTAVAEDKGQIEVTRGEISSTAETIVLTDNADGGVNFEVNIDNDTIVQDETTKALKVASAALTQYVGDGKTIEISAADANNNKTVSTLLTLSSVTPSSTTVKEEYALKNASGETIGSTIKIYKDSSLVSIELVNEDPTQDPPKAGQFLKYTYIDASGATQSVYVDVSALLVEAEFESGVTANAAGVVHGVVDPISETFLTVGANGFKLAGVQDAIDAAVADLDATVNNNANSGHVAVEIVETDGKLVSVTVTEDDIASADDIEELSGKTVTEISSSNASISATSAATADGTVGYDLVTDASKIKMTGFTAETSGLTAITTSSTVTEAVKAIENKFIANDGVLAGLRDDIDTVSGDVDTIKEQYISGVSVNNHAVLVADHVAPISITAATSATTASTANAIVVDTDAKGNITLGLNYIDCGTY